MVLHLGIELDTHQHFILRSRNSKNEKRKKKYRSFDEYLINNSKEYNLKITAMEVGFLESILSKYISDKENEHRAKDIAAILKGRLKPIISKIYEKG